MLAPFSRQLYCTPPRPPDAVVELVLQHPRVFSHGSFANNCISFGALAQASTPFCAELAVMPLNELVPYLCCSPTRLKYVQYLVQTQQPLPWAYGLRWLLLSTHFTVKELRERFSAAYPGFVQWEQSMESL
jgi:hypothetical protein